MREELCGIWGIRYLWSCSHTINTLFFGSYCYLVACYLTNMSCENLYNYKNDLIKHKENGSLFLAYPYIWGTLGFTEFEKLQNRNPLTQTCQQVLQASIQEHVNTVIKTVARVGYTEHEAHETGAFYQIFQMNSKCDIYSQ